MPDTKTAVPVPAGFLRQHWSHWLAMGFGSGLVPKAPGTAGTLFAWGAWVLMAPWLEAPAQLFVALWALLLGVWVCERATHALGVHDHPAIVWDEIAAFWLVLYIVPSSWPMQLLAFGVFRFFDMVKPAPISWLDARVKGGFGVMIDDLAAAIATVAVLVCVQMLWAG